jgi:hypothetical protein
MRLSQISTTVLALGCAACTSVRGSDPTTVSTTPSIASAYWFRGTPQSLDPVAQADLSVRTPLKNDATLLLQTWLNYQLTNDTNDGIIPDSQGGQFTEIDLVADYSTTIGGVGVNGGVIGYQFPGIFPSTKEVYVGAAKEALGLAFSATFFYDFDLLDDFYVTFLAGKGFELDENLALNLGLQVSYMAEDQSAYYFGTEESGLSDASLSGTLTYQHDDNTSFFFKLAGVTVPDSDLGDSLDTLGFDDSGVWGAVGVSWGL